MSYDYDLAQFPIKKERAYRFARNICGMLTAVSVTGLWVYIQFFYAGQSSHNRASVVLVLLLVSMVLGLVTACCVGLQRTMRIDDKGFHYAFNFTLLTFRWDEVAVIEKATIYVGRGSSVDGIKVTFKSDGRHKPKVLSFTNDFATSPDRLIGFLRECTETFGSPQPFSKARESIGRRVS